MPMDETDSSERIASSLTLRFLDGLPASPALLSLGVALLTSGVLLLAELGSGRLAWLAGNSEDGLRNLRLAVGFIALVAYLPVATLYVLRGARRTVDEMRPMLRLDDDSVRAVVDAIGTQPATAFRRAGWIGVFVALTIPLIVDLPRGVFPYSLNQPIETVWHRIATPIVGWWSVRLVYVILLESGRLSNLARGLRTVDLFDLAPLLPFARQGLTHALLLIGFVTIFAVMSFFEVGFGVAAGLITLVSLPATVFGMLMPVQGVHNMIRDEKKRRLAWCQERLRGLQSDASAGQLDAPVLRELADVLTLRAHLEAVREWPFDVSVVARLAFYLVIPLVSWAGAAVVERAVNAFLG
jgi:hypothetical protein